MKKRHICLNMVGSTTWMGGAIYTQNLARAIASLPPAERHPIRLSVRVNQNNLTVAEPIRNDVDQIYAHQFWQQGLLKLRKVLADRCPWIPTSLLNPEQLSFVYPTIAGKRSPYAWGAWIPDFQHYHLPELFAPEEIETRNAWHQAVARNAPVIVLSSEMARQDFIRAYPAAAERSTVMNFVTALDAAWFQPDPQLIQQKYNLPDRFFLVSNQFWKHKGHTAIVEALSLLNQHDIQPTIVCTGNPEDPRHPDYYPQLLTLIDKLGVSNQIKILGLIPRIDQIQLMRRCLAVIQPSRFEGWSTVVEDARSLGKPMLLSDFPVHLEQNPAHSQFFEQDNIEQLADLMAIANRELVPGPCFEKEAIAKQENADRVQAFGRQFLKIVNQITLSGSIHEV